MVSEGKILIDSDTFFKCYDSWRFENHLENTDSVELLTGFDEHIGLKFTDQMIESETDEYGSSYYVFKLMDKDKWFLSKIKYGF
jgi:hypothetical protein